MSVLRKKESYDINAVKAVIMAEVLPRLAPSIVRSLKASGVDFIADEICERIIKLLTEPSKSIAAKFCDHIFVVDPEILNRKTTSDLSSEISSNMTYIHSSAVSHFSSEIELKISLDRAVGQKITCKHVEKNIANYNKCVDFAIYKWKESKRHLPNSRRFVRKRNRKTYYLSDADLGLFPPAA